MYETGEVVDGNDQEKIRTINALPA